MEIEILGSGGAVAVPRAFCTCRVCSQARENPHPPYVRDSPSLFIHDLDLLIDTPEEIRIQLNRSGIRAVETVAYTHWHPDHTAGIRVFEGNYEVVSLLDRSRTPRTTSVILPERVAHTFEHHHALAEKLGYLERFGLVRTDRVAPGARVVRGEWTITPVELAEDFAVGYLFEGSERVLVCMDEVFGYQPVGLGQLDLAILPCGFFTLNPITGEPIIDPDHPVLAREPSFEQTLTIARQTDAPRVVFVHLNHGLGLTPEEYGLLERRLQNDPTLPDIEFAFDTMRISVRHRDD